MRTSLVAGFLALSLAGGGIALAQSKCDQGVSKAAGKKVKCKMDVIAKGQVTPDAVKLAKCEEKFDKACLKAKARPIAPLRRNRARPSSSRPTRASLILDGSPSGAFLE